MDSQALKHFDLINNFLEKDGYKNTLKAQELRSFEWQKGNNKVVLIMNFSATELKLTYTNI